MRKTPLMEQVEKRLGKTLEETLPEMFNELGLEKMADELGVGKSTVWYWLLRCRVSFQKVALRPGERLEIRKETGYRAGGK